jgi:hypothetical protein
MHLRLALTLALLAGLRARAGEGEGFVPLVRGDDPAQFELVGISPESIRIEGGEVRLTGTPPGYFATRTAYRNYMLRFDWRFERPDGLTTDDRFSGNSGVLLHIEPPGKVWPRSIEVQLFPGDAGHVFAIAGARFEGTADPEAQSRALRPVGQWNQAVITCRDGSIISALNGVVVSRGRHASPDRGPLGWQSEGAPVRFRNLLLKPLD